jgi:hypothetical protein
MVTNPNYDAQVCGWTFDKKVAFFFGNTPTTVPTGRIYSTLAHILSDIRECADGGSNKLAFPRAMCLMVAIDLLAKMHAGSDTNGVGQRFKDFTEYALQGTKFGTDIGQKIYGFRNALHHSYRLPTAWKPKGVSVNTSWRFRLVEEQSNPKLTWDTPDHCTFINLYKLQEEIEAAVNRFQSLVAGYSTPDDQRRFSSMFDKYGWLYVGE